MRTILLGLIGLLAMLVSLAIVTSAYAAPFLVADVPTPDADTCVYTAASGAPFTSSVVVDAALGLPANANRVCKVDLVASPVGTNNVKLRLRNVANAPLWGDSVDVGFSFVRPAVQAPPAAMRLVP
jgi:hypothetical protein